MYMAEWTLLASSFSVHQYTRPTRPIKVNRSVGMTMTLIIDRVDELQSFISIIFLRFSFYVFQSNDNKILLQKV